MHHSTSQDIFEDTLSVGEIKELHQKKMKCSINLLLIFAWALCEQELLHVEANGGFVQTRGLQFVLDGAPFFINGFNSYWLMSFGADPSHRSKVSTAFEQASMLGLTVARAWAFSDGGYSPLQYSPGSYDENMFKGLDFLISEARKYGIRLILSLVNNYDSFGGKKQYLDWARSRGEHINSADDFFLNSVVRGFYKNHVRTVLTRVNTITGVPYKDDPTIFAWELMNEPRLTSDLSGATLQAWIREMAAYVKSIDSNHLLEVGIEGFYGESSPQKNPGFLVGTDFISNNQIQGIDFATVHAYPDQWLSNASYQEEQSFLNSWIDTHIQDAQNILKKPVLFTEFGKSSKDPCYNTSQRDILFNTMYIKTFSSARRGGAAAGCLFWQLLIDGMDNYRDGYEVILKESTSTANMILQESRKLYQLRWMYARLMNTEKLRRARALGIAQKNGGKNIG